MTRKLLNLTNDKKNILKSFSYEGDKVELINLKRSEIEKIWDPKKIFGRTDTEDLMDNLPALAEVASQCCDNTYTGSLVGICENGFKGLLNYHERFNYKCAEIISSHLNRKRLKSFVGINHAGIYILIEAPIRADLLIQAPTL